MSPHLRAGDHANCGGVTELALVKLLMPQRPVMDHDMSGVVINVDIDTFGNLLLIWFKSMVRKYPWEICAGYIVVVVVFYKEEATLANLL